jgi:hypothetical protein
MSRLQSQNGIQLVLDAVYLWTLDGAMTIM